jgi:hypothetical protein
MEVAELAHLRRARDMLDRDYALPLNVPAMARAVDQPYGVRDAAVRDPSGNHLRLSQPLPAQG